MNKQREALQIALQAMEDHAKQYPHMQKGYTVDAIEALREALAEQEPVAVVASQTGDPVTMSWHHEPALPIGTKLYTAPPARKPLNHDQIVSLIPYLKSLASDEPEIDFARAIERAHGIGEP